MRKEKIRRTLFLLGGVLWLSGCSREEEITFFPTEGTAATYEEMEQAGTQEAQLFVYVCGAVETPGVVLLDADARVVDAIEMVGGMTKEADETYVNLAARLTDGEKIYVPTKAEVAKWEEAERAENKVNINTADIDTLCSLPGIGESKAEDIIRYREQKGFFKAPEELMQVSGIKESLFEKLADKIKVE